MGGNSLREATGLAQGPRANAAGVLCDSPAGAQAGSLLRPGTGQATALGGFCSPAGNPQVGRARLWPVLSEAVGQAAEGLSGPLLYLHPKPELSCSPGDGQGIKWRGGLTGTQEEAVGR